MGVRFLRVSNYRAFAPSDGAGCSLSGEVPFSQGINLFVGPNGSGKTSAMNALKRVFGRATETTQRVVSYEHEKATDLCAEHHDIAHGWWIEADVSWEDDVHAVARISHEPLADHHARKLNGIALEGPADAHAGWSLIYDRGFPLGWPREITHLDSPAFKHPAYPENNLYYYKKVWNEIREDARRLLDTDLACTPDELAISYECPTPGCNWTEPLHEARCSRCGLSPRVKEDGRRHPGLRFQDRNGARLFHASDGQGHILFMIMEIRKHLWSTSFLLEEPDVYLHPSLQKRFVEYLDELAQGCRHQFFITSHSPYLLTSIAGLAAESDSRAVVYRFQYEDRGSREWSGTGVEIPKMIAFRSLLSSVGHSPADVLEANGVIWVEGPSDMLYLKCWLELYAKGLSLIDQKDARVRWGLDARLLIYGGSNLGLVDPEPDFWLVENSSAHARLLELAQSRQNAAVLLDRDDGIKEGSVRASIMSAFAGANRYAWTQREPHRTIEDCVAPGILEGTHPLQSDTWLRRVPRGCGGELRWEHRGKREAAESYAKWALKYDLKDVVDQTSGVLELVSKIHAVVLGWRR